MLLDDAQPETPMPQLEDMTLLVSEDEAAQFTVEYSQDMDTKDENKLLGMATGEGAADCAGPPGTSPLGRRQTSQGSLGGMLPKVLAKIL